MKELLEKIILKIRWVFRKHNSVVDISEKREEIEFYRKLYKSEVLVETGTFLGDTVEYFKNKFDEVISIELSKEIAEKATKRFAADKNVTILQGDSSIILPSLFEGFKGPVLFWLDGHYSSEFFIGEEFIRTAKGEKNTPIENELDIILQSSIECVILIDDARLFNGKDDYPTIREIVQKVSRYNIDSKVLVNKDIIHIIPNKK
jgi:hypothetical protein